METDPTPTNETATMTPTTPATTIRRSTTTEPDIAKRKNDSKCLLYRIIYILGIKYFHTRYALLPILFLKTSILNPEIFAIRILI